jgi:SpoVK/Ycf46/Vps4 family AAA+-type ATPase
VRIMASANLLKKLFKSYKQRDDEGFYAVALEIIADEKRKKHNLLARDLQRIIENGNGGLRHFDNQPIDYRKLPRDKEQGTVLVEVFSPEKIMSDIVLDGALKKQIFTIFDEFRAQTILKTYGLDFKRKILFAGPPGCGKTLAASVIANELGLPMLYTRFDAVISSYLGETASNLRKVFDFAERGSWLVFFDEFDAIGKSRDNVEEHGELKRVVNTFLQLLDNFRSDSLVIAATNHEILLDKALWRRFDDILYFDLPDSQQIYDLIEIKLRGVSHVNLEHEKYVKKMQGWSHADIERVCLDAVKISVLKNSEYVTDKHFEDAFQRQKNRFGIIKKTRE